MRIILNFSIMILLAGCVMGPGETMKDELLRECERDRAHFKESYYNATSYHSMNTQAAMESLHKMYKDCDELQKCLHYNVAKIYFDQGENALRCAIRTGSSIKVFDPEEIPGALKGCQASHGCRFDGCGSKEKSQ